MQEGKKGRKREDGKIRKRRGGMENWKGRKKGRHWIGRKQERKEGRRRKEGKRKEGRGRKFIFINSPSVFEQDTDRHKFRTGYPVQMTNDKIQQFEDFILHLRILIWNAVYE